MIDYSQYKIKLTETSHMQIQLIMLSESIVTALIFHWLDTSRSSTKANTAYSNANTAHD